MFDVTITVPVAKLNVEQGIVTGWASIVTDADGVPIIDSEGDVIPIDELEKAVHLAFSERDGRGKVGDMHEKMGVGDIVESIVLTKEKRLALGLGDGPEGWVVTLKIHDKKTLDKLKRGERLELSIRGTADAEDIA